MPQKEMIIPPNRCGLLFGGANERHAPPPLQASENAPAFTRPLPFLIAREPITHHLFVPKS